MGKIAKDCTQRDHGEEWGLEDRKEKDKEIKAKKENESMLCIHSHGFPLTNLTVAFLCLHICCDVYEVPVKFDFCFKKLMFRD